MIRNFLCACAMLSLTMHVNISSAFLFGEYPYPSEEQDA